MTFPGKRRRSSTKSLEHGYLFVYDFWQVYDYMLACLYSGGKKPMMQKQAPEANKNRQHLIYITLTIEFEQQRFLNVLYSGLDM